MSNRSETFGRLLKGAINSIATYEGKTAPVIEEELAEKVSLAGSAFQRYKSGYLPPDPRTVEIIAEAAVQRGFFSREWLQRFLHAARYHQADKLLDQLCPVGSARPRPPRVYQNLPAPTYSQFVMRQEAFAEILDGLGKRSAAVIIVGLGGNGKTSLAREIGDHCLKGEEGQTLFDAAVWVSDKDRPGTTNLSIVLDEIARTLDYPGFTQFEHDEKRREVEQLLRRQRVLVCIDNFETITDGALLSWLLNLPEPSKALITTREYRREYRRGGWPVELRGMSDGEAQALIHERLRVLRIEKLVGDWAQIEPLLVATGGNPKAIEMTLGLVKYERRPLQQVIDELYAARGELFEDLFGRAWALLDEAARRVLLVMTMFPASAGSEALSHTADIQEYTFARVVELLVDMALLDVHQTNLEEKPRLTLHPLVRAFALSKFTQQQELFANARHRWLQWYLQLVSRVGFCWNDLSRLDLLDAEQDTLVAVTEWISSNRLYKEAIILDRGVGYYYYVRGLWERKQTLNVLRINAARQLGDVTDEAKALSYHVETLGKQGNIAEAERHVPRLRQILSDSSLSPDARFDVQHAIAFFAMGNEDYLLALQEWESAERFAEPGSMRLAFASRWKAACLMNLGQLEVAKQILQSVLLEAQRLGSQRSVTFCLLKLAAIDLELGDLNRAADTIKACSESTARFQDRVYIAVMHHTAAQLELKRGHRFAAYENLIKAIDLFERLGMRHELTQAREELRRLDDPGEAPAA